MANSSLRDLPALTGLGQTSAMSGRFTSRTRPAGRIGPVGPASGRRGRRVSSTAIRRIDETSSNSDMAIDETRRIHSGGLSANQYI